MVSMQWKIHATQYACVRLHSLHIRNSFIYKVFNRIILLLANFEKPLFYLTTKLRQYMHCFEEVAWSVSHIEFLLSSAGHIQNVLCYIFICRLNYLKNSKSISPWNGLKRMPHKGKVHVSKYLRWKWLTVQTIQSNFGTESVHTRRHLHSVSSTVSVKHCSIN